MPSRIRDDAAPSAPSTSPTKRDLIVSMTKSLFKFILLVVSSLVLNAAVISLGFKTAFGSLGPLIEQVEIPHVGSLVAWRTVELGFARVLGFDGEDYLMNVWNVCL